MAPTTPEPDPIVGGHREPGPAPTPPARWPGAVRLPGSPGFEQSAKAWLFDLAPARWRYEELLHKHPLELARMVRLRLEADIAAMQAGLRGLRGSLLGHRPADACDVYAREHAWASAMRDQVELIEEALTSALATARRRPSLPRPRPATGRS
ncbi:hypothetical protein [Streptomyces sp. ICBB 8177]|uniref:hypothetical protein n=1 Tax=Streptomyces sp. ICBB 8177 TaxID=563922 RepID=UPI0018EEC9AF|nr:hypothetical protein [Streptomyces sp. ICBB 8177]